MMMLIFISKFFYKLKIMNNPRAEETGAQIISKHSVSKELRECRICLQNEK